MFGRIDNNIVDDVINQCSDIRICHAISSSIFFLLHSSCFWNDLMWKIETKAKTPNFIFIIFEMVWKFVDKTCQKCWTSKYWPMMIKQWTIGHCQKKTSRKSSATRENFTMHMCRNSSEAKSGLSNKLCKIESIFPHKSSSLESTSIKINAN